MKHAKRMVLVPEDALQRYEQRQRLGTPPIMASIMREDTDMSNILQRTDLNDDEKQKLYYANLERYLDLWRQKDRPTAPPVSPAASKKELPNVAFGHLPATNRERATALLNMLKASPILYPGTIPDRLSLKVKLFRKQTYPIWSAMP